MKKCLIYIAIALTTLIAGFMGCGKKDQDVKEQQELKSVKNQQEVKCQDVYVAGVEEGIPTLWKNGVAQRLSDRDWEYGGWDNLSIFVSGDDVYVAGRLLDEHGGIQRATLWKNGVDQQLQLQLGDSHGISSVFVSDGNVYVAGKRWGGWGDDDGNTCFVTLLENGVPQRLGDEQANSVFVSGNDVYVVGNVTLWKNGAAQRLSDDGQAHSVYVSGNDVYVAGREGPWDSAVATVWKNGVPRRLGNGEARSVFVSGKDVYVAGDQNNAATLWKNGVPQRLSYDNKNPFAKAHSVYVSGNDVYVAGCTGRWKHGRYDDAILWKNGIPQRLSSDVTIAEAMSVFVK
ncbi:MAG: hypothetical protein LBQ86_05350 [Holophagales bacterium]|nr:hypothetical protein [Holophagales bacterium]